jgi:hypothetical protein
MIGKPPKVSATNNARIREKWPISGITSISFKYLFRVYFEVVSI